MIGNMKEKMLLSERFEIAEQLSEEAPRFWGAHEIEEFARRIVEKIRDRSRHPKEGLCIVQNFVALLDWNVDIIDQLESDMKWGNHLHSKPPFPISEVFHLNDDGFFDEAGERLYEWLIQCVRAEVLEQAASASPEVWQILSECDNTLGRYLQEPVALVNARSVVLTQLEELS